MSNVRAEVEAGECRGFSLVIMGRAALFSRPPAAFFGSSEVCRDMGRIMVILAVLGVAIPTTAHAGLTGDEVTALWAYPPSSLYQTHDLVVGPGPELVGNWGGGHSLDIGDDYIESLLPDVVAILPGLNWHFSSLDYGGIGGVSVSTNFTGWKDSWATFTEDSVDVNFVERVEFPLHEGYLRVTLVSVPEPPSGSLVLAGLAGVMAVFQWRPKTRSTAA